MRTMAMYVITPIERHTEGLGWAQVEGEAQGAEENIQKLVRDLNEGPRHAHVTKVDHKEIETVDGEGGFEVRAWDTQEFAWDAHWD
jgi:hypothetical protein